MDSISDTQIRWEKGLACLREQAYWQAHEEWEEIWSHLPTSPLRATLQALIQVAAACYKPQQARAKGSAVAGMQKGMAALIKTARQHLDSASGQAGALLPSPGFPTRPIYLALDALALVHQAWIDEKLDLSVVETRLEPITDELAQTLQGQPLRAAN